MSDITQDQPVSQRTVAFFADPRAPKLLLTETVEKLIESLEIDQGIVDITTMAGVDIALAFVNAGVPFATLEYGQEPHYDQPDAEHSAEMSSELRRFAAANVAMHEEQLVNEASGVVYRPVNELGTVDANVVLVPAMVGPNEKLLDFSHGSLIGTVLSQLEETGRDAIVIDTPERGLRPMGDGSYQRAIIHVQTGASNS